VRVVNKYSNYFSTECCRRKASMSSWYEFCQVIRR